MAAVTRQPFAPLDGARLQSLTSLKNRQNAVAPPSAGKRKAELLDTDDAENVDPIVFAKRSKGASASSSSPFKDTLLKPASPFILTRAAPSTAATTTPASARLPLKHSSTPRRTLQPKSPAARLNTAIAKSSPASAPAGRSPTRGKRAGILSSRRRSGPYTRVDPPSFGLGKASSAAPFSLDAALKGTISSYAPPPPSTVSSSSRAKATSRSSSSLLDEPEAKASWFFDIHEDTPEQEMTNLLQHSTCVLDISSDEESERKASRERDEGRDKENVPPPDDVSQTRGAQARAAPRLSADDMVVEKERVALGEMNAVDFYADGCDESSVVLVHEDEEEPSARPQNFAFAPELKSLNENVDEDAETDREDEDIEGDAVAEVAALMGAAPSTGSSKAAVLQPMDGTGESFDLWESGSTKDETEAAAAS
ncbi:thymidylate kinase [Purpureocillium lavendulum]|uniref:Thymidylate kinase n=1 Tax=Purpureocillium lavendulum TaxID=1247861 RepID=A0AB34FND1_9HYPO|nr:thymidylate kinase [Purpureocillium lavendulum]